MKEQKLNIKGCSVSLAAKDGPLQKKTLICREGSFEGLYGPVEVTPAKLQLIAEHYNKQRANPQNENDYAPILLDHMRAVDNIQGRLMPGLVVAPWVDPETGQTLSGLYGDLRVDTSDAIEKVEQGIYSQVSLCFDEETGEIFEVSFVAVEAARRSQVLSQGEGKMEKQLAALSAKNESLVKRVKALKTIKQASGVALSQNAEVVSSEIQKAMDSVKAITLALKTAALASQFKGFVKKGKLELAEFKKLNIAELATLDPKALKTVLSAYDSRPVSADFTVHGQAGTPAPKFNGNNPAIMRDLIALQKSGKRSVTLAEGEEKPKDKDGKELSAEEIEKQKLAEGEKPEGEKGEKDKEALSFDDLEETMKGVEGMGPVLEKCMDTMKKMSEHLKKLAEDDKEQEEE